MSIRNLFLSSAAAVALLSSYASAHFDFKPYVSGSKILSGGHDDEKGTDVDVLRAAGYDFGEVADDPYNIGDPGFNTLGASAFAGGTQLRLRGQSVDGRFLRYWNGTGTPNFGAAPAGVSIDLAGSPTRYATFADAAVTYSPSSTPSLLIGSFAGNGAMHIHLTSSVFKNGLQTPGSVPDGAYLIAFDLLNRTADGSGATAVANSDRLFVVYNNGLTEEQHDAAIDFAAAINVPEPASLATLAAGMALVLRRRRRA